ncbi:MAG: GatB/YqeY domain-containing protein [Thermoanaerobaculia bacterium]
MDAYERVSGDLKAAMKGGDKERVATLRMLLAAIQNERIAEGRAVDEEGLYGLVRRGVKQRREAVEAYRGGGREEAAAREEREIAILEEYLPAQVDEETLRAAVRELVDAEGLTGPQAIGQVMKTLLPRFAGRADGATLSRIAREELAS